MADKIRITVTAVVEYEPNQAYYPGCATPEDMLKVDLDNANDDTLGFIGGDNVDWKIVGEVIKGN